MYYMYIPTYIKNYNSAEFLSSFTSFPIRDRVKWFPFFTLISQLPH